MAKTNLEKQEGSSLLQLLSLLPNLPAAVHYYDDYEDTRRSVNNFDLTGTIEVHTNGTKRNIAFDSFGENYGQLLKYIFTYLVSQDYQMSSTSMLLSFFSYLSEAEISEALAIKPIEVNSWWALMRSKNYPPTTYSSLKVLLRFLCTYHLIGWAPSYFELIFSLPHPYVDKYASVRTGEAFLSVEEESAVVRHLDDLASSIRSVSSLIHNEVLIQGCALLCSYLFGLRPIQIALLSMRDVRIWDEPGKDGPTVHLTFRMVKQHSKSKSFPITRRIKHDWTPIIIEQYERLRANGREGNARFIPVKSAQSMSTMIASIASEVVGVDICATDLRHTAAQRLVDAGATQEEVAEFLTHSAISTSLVYFQTSPNQAERVNKALGISDIYRRVAKIAHDKFISPDELAELKETQQIAGVPHGIPIAGIGGCAIGQPSCPYNPITSCYGCRKFMPVVDIELHKRVLADMRGVINFFVDASQGDTHSPTYMQLRRAIANIQQVIAELEEPDNV